MSMSFSPLALALLNAGGPEQLGGPGEGMEEAPGGGFQKRRRRPIAEEQQQMDMMNLIRRMGMMGGGGGGPQGGMQQGMGSLVSALGLISTAKAKTDFKPMDVREFLRRLRR